MNPMYVSFGEWMPDQPSANKSCSVATNVIPHAASYRSINSLAPFTAALTSKCLGGFWAADSIGTINNFTGDATKLYRLAAGAWDDVSKVGGYTADRWEFIKWGDRVIATTIESPMQYYDMGSSTEFADLPGTPPQAAHIGIVRDFIVTGDIYEASQSYPSRIRWSGYNNSEQWTPSQSTQSDYQDLLGNGGRIQRIIPGQYGVIIQESSIWRMDYVGPPVIFQFSEVETQRGTPAPGSVGYFGRRVFYWGGSGFYMFDGQSSTGIGAEKVDRYVYDDLDTSRLDEFSCAIDRLRNLVVWSYPSLSRGTVAICYNFIVNRWSLLDVKMQYVYEYISSGYSLDELDTILADIDSASFPVDSTAYLGGKIALAAFDDQGRLGLFDGPELPAIVETGDILSPSDQMLYIEKLRVLAEGENLTKTVQHASRTDQSQAYIYGPSISENSYGEFSVLRKGRYHRVRVTINGGADQISGVNVKLREAGTR